VRDYQISKGFDPATLEAEGRGELEPKFPNDGEANRRKNRRVDIVAMTMEEIEQPAPGPIQISSEPAWIQRALRNPAEHKRTVDVYRIDDRHNINNGPPAGDGSPDAVDDNVTINQDSGATVIDVLANDSDPNGDTLTIVSVTSPANGCVINNGTSVTYTPNPGFNGIDTFTYTIDDGNGNTDTATVTVNVSPGGGDGGNNPPDAVDDNAVTNRNTPVTIDVLANDSDPDGDPLVVSAVTQPTVGSVVNNGSNVTFTPRRNFRGTVTFTYTAADGRGGTDTATVTVDIPIY
jgi:hypothetical protein